MLAPSEGYTVYSDIKPLMASTFRIAESYSETVKEMQKSIDSLSNLANQYVCAESVNVDSIFRNHPNILILLKCKIKVGIDSILLELKASMDRLRIGSEQVKKLAYKSQIVLDKYQREDTLDALNSRTPIYPAVSELCLWIASANQLMNEDYAYRNCLISSTDFAQMQMLLEFASTWDEPELGKLMQDIKPFCHFLLSEVVEQEIVLPKSAAILSGKENPM